MLVVDRAPAPKCRFNSFDFFKNIGSAPFDGAVVIRSVPMLKHLDKGVCDSVEMSQDFKAVDTALRKLACLGRFGSRLARCRACSSKSCGKGIHQARSQIGSRSIACSDLLRKLKYV